jgi:hypothetical protein
MTLATRLVEFLDAQAERAALIAAERAARDAFIVTQFPQLNLLLEERMIAAVGSHSRLLLGATAQTLAVTGRSFATLPQRVLRLAATVGTLPLSITFTPALDFRFPDQFGRIECVPDFDASLRRSRAGAVARSLIEEGIQMRGSSSAHLMLLLDGRWTELTISHLEDAFAALLLR